MFSAVVAAVAAAMPQPTVPQGPALTSTTPPHSSGWAAPYVSPELPSGIPEALSLFEVAALYQPHTGHWMIYDRKTYSVNTDSLKPLPKKGWRITGVSIDAVADADTWLEAIRVVLIDSKTAAENLRAWDANGEKLR
jgi:hypothetical protein